MQLTKLASLLMIFIGLSFAACKQNNASPNADTTSVNKDSLNQFAPIDTADYNKRIAALCINDTTGNWPVKTPYPLPGAILPFKRVLAYYGNLYSKRMGILGELPKDEMLARLAETQKLWEAVDSTTPVLPALHYVAMSAQSAPGKDGKYRMLMPFHQVDTIIKWAREIKGIAFLDIQVGTSTVQEEMPKYIDYLKMPDVHFGLDPEFSMKTGRRPGTIIGTMDATDINFAVDYLADLVRKHNLPPKILIVHRFTKDMITNYANIKNIPEVQVVIDMDGWGGKVFKMATYRSCITKEAVNLTGFKIFYKNDTKKDKNALLSPEEVMAGTVPKPIYIQYQ